MFQKKILILRFTEIKKLKKNEENTLKNKYL